MKLNYDVFISHAGEDKETLAFPIYENLKRRGIVAFLDRIELRKGDNAPDAMKHGMKTAPVGLFLLSPDYAAKNWPMLEAECFVERAERSENDENDKIGIPKLIPVFYRLSVAECKDRLTFDRYSATFNHHCFGESGKRTADDVLSTLRKLAVRTGIENKDGATNDDSTEMKRKRQKLVELIGEEVSRVVGDLYRLQALGVHGVALQNPEGERFVPAFYGKGNSPDVVLDFSSAFCEEEAKTAEAMILRDVLQTGSIEDRARIIAIKGGAGVGKSCILRAIVRHQEVRGRFPGGTYFLSLGMDATEESLRSELLKAMRMSGGRERAMQLRDERSIDAVMDSLQEWFQEKKCLLGVDDAWDRKALRAREVGRLCRLFSDHSGSVVILTTRFSWVARFGVVHDVEPKDPFSQEAEAILLRCSKFTREEIEEAGLGWVLKDLLRLCAGLPVSLGAMGKGIRELSMHLGTQRIKALDSYRKMVLKNSETIMQAELDDYGDLRAALSTSLSILEENCRARNVGNPRLSFSQMHRSLCILEKQVEIPFGVLKVLWRMRDEDEVLMVVKGFADVGLAEMDISAFEGTKVLRLHDLIHEFATISARSADEQQFWHKELLNGYMSESQGDQQVRPWWEVEDCGYLFDNLARHLVEGNITEELVELLLSAKWTLLRHENGGLLAWKRDFQLCIQGIQSDKRYSSRQLSEFEQSLCLIRDSATESWAFVNQNKQELGFQSYGRLGDEESSLIRRYLQSVSGLQKSPWMKPLIRCWNPPGQESSRMDFVLESLSWCISIHSGRCLAAVAAGKEVIIADLRENRILCRCKGHSKSVIWVAFDELKDEVLSYSADNILRRWDIETGKELGCFVINLNEPIGDVKKPDVSCSPARETGSDRNSSNLVKSIAWGADKDMLALSLTDGRVTVQDLARSKAQELVSDGRVDCIDITKDGRFVVGGEAGGCICIWDQLHHTTVPKVLDGHARNVLCVACSPCGMRAISGSSDGTMGLWSLDRGIQIANPFADQRCPLVLVRFSDDGEKVVSGDYEGRVCLWDAATGRQLRNIENQQSGRIIRLTVSGDLRFAAASALDRAVRVWDLTNTNNSRGRDSSRKTDLCCIARSPNDCVFVTGSSKGMVYTWAGTTGKELGQAFCAHEDRVSCISFRQDGKRFVTGSSDRLLKIWDPLTRKQVGTSLQGHRGTVTDVAFTRDMRFIVSGSQDGSLRIWSPESQTQVRLLDGKIRTSSFSSLFDRTGAYLQGLLMLLRGNTDNKTYERRRAPLTRVTTCLDGRSIITGNLFGSVQLWDMVSGELMWTTSRECRHDITVKRLEVLKNGVVTSTDEFGVDKFWSLKRTGEQAPFVPLDTSEDKNCSRVSDKQRERVDLREVACKGRIIFRTDDRATLGTLPSTAYPHLWSYDPHEKILGVIAEDGMLFARFIEIEQCSCDGAVK